MKYALLLSFLLVGCSATPVKRNFPEAPQELKVSCPDLQKVKDNAKLSDVVSTVSTNYTQYHECRSKADAWTEWYENQKQIFESVK
jgi:predicted metallo-beta-lactamase superfamily hydrolase